MIRDSVRDFMALGPLPNEASPVDAFDPLFIERLKKIARPVSMEEASLLLQSFGPDDSFGLAWSLLQLVETAPDCPVTEPPPASANQWVRRIWESAQRGKAS